MVRPPVRALGFGVAFLLVEALSPPGVVTAQTSRPPQSNSFVPRGVETQAVPREHDPFRQLDLNGIRIGFLLLNDEACPVQVQPGPVTRAPNGKWVVAVDVIDLSDAPVKTLVFAALVFDAEGTFKADRTAGAGSPIQPRTKQRVELTLDRASFDAGDRVVLAVKEIIWTEGRWRSASDEVLMAARDAVSANTKPVKAP